MPVVQIVKNKPGFIRCEDCHRTGAILAATVDRGCHGQFLGFCRAGVCISRLVPKHQVPRTNSCFLLKCILIFY